MTASLSTHDHQVVARHTAEELVIAIHKAREQQRQHIQQIVALHVDGMCHDPALDGLLSRLREDIWRIERLDSQLCSAEREMDGDDWR